MVTAPSSGVCNRNGQWEVENIGIAFDIKLEHDPEAVHQGRDPRLENAALAVLAELKKNPPPGLSPLPRAGRG